MEGKTDPDCAGSESEHAAGETRLLPLGCYAFVDALAEPDIGLHVPGIEEDLEVRGEFNVEDIEVRSAGPE